MRMTVLGKQEGNGLVSDIPIVQIGIDPSKQSGHAISSLCTDDGGARTRRRVGVLGDVSGGSAGVEGGGAVAMEIGGRGCGGLQTCGGGMYFFVGDDIETDGAELHAIDVVMGD